MSFIVDVIYVKDNKNLCSFFFSSLSHSLNLELDLDLNVVVKYYVFGVEGDARVGSKKIGNKYAFSLMKQHGGVYTRYHHRSLSEILRVLSIIMNKATSRIRTRRVVNGKAESQNVSVLFVDNNMRNNNFPFSLLFFPQKHALLSLAH